MSVSRIPVLLWRDLSGLWTGAVVESPHLAAIDRNPQGCLDQLRAHLHWLQRNQPWNVPEPEILEGSLLRVQVSVRPEVVAKQRRMPAEYEVRIVVPCIYGRTASGMFACSIPTIGVWFMYHDAEQLREMASHYVRDALRGLSAQRLSRHLPPAEFELEQVLLNDPGERRRQAKPALPALEAVAEPIGERSVRKQFPRPYERDTEISDLVTRVHTDRASVLLVGEPGSGKTSVLVAASREIERKRESGDDRRLFWQTSGSRLIAGTPYLGQWEERLEEALEQLAAIDGVLCVENLLELVRMGGYDAGDSVGAFLVPYLRMGELRMIAEATPAELDACRRLLPPLAEAMQVLPVAPMPHASALRVLDRLAASAERNQRLTIGGEAVSAVGQLFRRFRPYDSMPGKAAQFLTSLAQAAANTQGRTVNSSTVMEQFRSDTGLPEKFLRDELPLQRSEVLTFLSARVMGQAAACESAAGVILAFKAGLNDPHRPLGAMLFAGPTGVGKTELARAMADYLFGAGAEKDRLVRLDMSEYAGASGAERLISDSNGEPSEFLRKVRSQPFCVVLLDEIEKADVGVFDVLLGLLDEGRLTDRYGRVTSFQSCVIVLTSNLGSGSGGALGFGAQRGPDFDGAVARFFRPEFYNRLDAVVAFKALDEATVRRIADKELAELAAREGIVAMGIKLEWTPEVATLVAQAGFDHRYGARPLQRALDELVATPLARLLAADPALRNCTLMATAQDGKVQFAHQRA
ncbi:MAG: ATP-dependent Clp protease ATP-binding subunit [Planctomycetes bacterium]|nr:ATP-dependent Clp protease ATP-binding subunit [Planctomycetota bacterium]